MLGWLHQKGPTRLALRQMYFLSTQDLFVSDIVTTSLMFLSRKKLLIPPGSGGSLTTKHISLEKLLDIGWVVFQRLCPMVSPER
jgi:hypothetical protein